jgi:hypothetical protein
LKDLKYLIEFVVLDRLEIGDKDVIFNFFSIRIDQGIVPTIFAILVLKVIQTNISASKIRNFRLIFTIDFGIEVSGFLSSFVVADRASDDLTIHNHRFTMNVSNLDVFLFLPFWMSNQDRLDVIGIEFHEVGFHIGLEDIIAIFISTIVDEENLANGIISFFL